MLLWKAVTIENCAACHVHSQGLCYMWIHVKLPLNINACPLPSSETQGQSVGPGEKARRKFSSTGGRAPGYRLSPDHFQTVKWMLAPDWAQKMLCIIVPNRRTVSREFFSWVRTRWVLCRHSCPVRSPSLSVQGKLPFSTFLTRNEGPTDESKNVSDAISTNNSFCTEKILFLKDHNVS